MSGSGLLREGGDALRSRSDRVPISFASRMCCGQGTEQNDHKEAPVGRGARDGRCAVRFARCITLQFLQEANAKPEALTVAAEHQCDDNPPSCANACSTRIQRSGADGCESTCEAARFCTSWTRQPSFTSQPGWVDLSLAHAGAYGGSCYGA